MGNTPTGRHSNYELVPVVKGEINSSYNAALLLEVYHIHTRFVMEINTYLSKLYSISFVIQLCNTNKFNIKIHYLDTRKDNLKVYFLYHTTFHDTIMVKAQFQSHLEAMTRVRIPPKPKQWTFAQYQRMSSVLSRPNDDKKGNRERDKQTEI